MMTMTILPPKPPINLFGTLFLSVVGFSIATVDPTFHVWATDAALTLLSLFFAVTFKAFRSAVVKLDEVHQVTMLIRMEHEQLIKDWQSRHPGEVRASVTFAHAMAIGKSASANG